MDFFKAISDFFSGDSAAAPRAQGPADAAEYDFDLFLSHKQTTGGDLAGRIKVELEALRPGIRVFLDADALGDIHDLAAIIRKTRCFVLLLTPEWLESMFVLRELAAAVRSQRRILVVWDRERLPNFPQIDSRTALPRIDEMHDAELRWTLQRVLMIKAVQYMRERALREAALREILERCDAAQPFRMDGEPPAAAAAAPGPINHGAGRPANTAQVGPPRPRVSRTLRSPEQQGAGAGGAGAARPPPPPQLPPGWSVAQTPDGRTYYWHEATNETQWERPTPPAPPPPPGPAGPQRQAAPAAAAGAGEILVRPGESIVAAVVRAAPGQTVRVQPGRYKEQLVLDKDVHIHGSREAVLEWDQDVTLHCKGPAAPSVKGITICNTAPEEPAVWITGGSRAIVEGCDVSSSGSSGFQVKDKGTAPTLRGNAVHDCGGAGIIFHTSAKGVAEGNDVYGNVNAGIEIKTGADPVVKGNKVHDGKAGGIFVNENGRGTVEGNDVYGNALAGIEIREGSDPVFKGNRVHDQKYGICVRDGGKGTISGNTLERISDPSYAPCSGVKVLDGCTPAVQGNTFRQ
eukprot:tig00000157_g9712.t1